MGAEPVACCAVRRGALRRSVVARARRARHRAGPHRAGHHGFDAARIHQLSVLAFAADTGALRRASAGRYAFAGRATPHASRSGCPGLPIVPADRKERHGYAGSPGRRSARGIWEDFIDIFYAPSAVFRRRENGNFFIPLAVITIVCGVLFYLNSGALQPMFDAEFDRGMAIAMRQNPNMPPEAVERISSFAVRMQQVVMFIFIPLAIFGVGVTTWLAGKLVDAKQTFRAALIVAAYAYAPRILDSVLLGLQACSSIRRSSTADSGCRSASDDSSIPIRCRRCSSRSSAAWISSRSGSRCSSRSDCASPAVFRCAKRRSPRRSCGSWVGCR